MPSVKRSWYEEPLNHASYDEGCKMLNEVLGNRIVTGRRCPGTEIVQQAAVSDGFGMRDLRNRVKVFGHFHRYRLRKKHVVHAHMEGTLAVIVLRKDKPLFSLLAFGAFGLLTFMGSMVYAYTNPAGVI